MAYLDSYIGGFMSFSGKTDAERMTAITSMMVDNFGATVHDVISTTKVVFKVQLSLRYPPFYIGLMVSGGYISFSSLSQGWNLSTHAGIRTITIIPDSMDLNGSFYVFAGKGVLLFNVHNSGCLGIGVFSLFCLPSLFHKDMAALTTSEIVAGTSVVIPLDANRPADMKIGSKILVADVNATNGIEQCVITAVGDTSVTVASLARTYPSGSYVFMPFYLGIANVYHSKRTLLCNAFLGNAASVAWSSLYSQNSSPSVSSWFSSDPASSKRVTCSFVFYSDVGVFGVLDTDAFLGLPTSLSSNDLLLSNNDGSAVFGGIASSGNVLTLVDSSKDWVPDSLVGKRVCILSGGGINSVRLISANTKDTITVSSPFYSAITSSSQYSVADVVYRVMEANAIQYGSNCAFFEKG